MTLEFQEIREGLKRLEPGLVFFEPAQRMDGINSGLYEPNAGVTTGVYRRGRFLFAINRGFVPEWDIVQVDEEEEETLKVRGWQKLFRLAVLNRVGSRMQIERTFGVHLAPFTMPIRRLQRSELMEETGVNI